MPSPFTEATLEGWPQTFEEFVFAAAQLLAYSDHPLEEIAPNDHYRQELEQAWQPPTPGHETLKATIMNQLQMTLEYDCDASHLTEPTRITGQELKQQELATARRNINHCREQYLEDIKFVKQRKAWVKALRESLAPPTPTTPEQTE